MGINIVFDKQKAIDNGMTFFNSINGNAGEIEEAVDRGCAKEFIDWLRKPVVLINVPNAPLSVAVEEHDGLWVCPANHWGKVYDPLTTWLRQNEIIWTEV